MKILTVAALIALSMTGCGKSNTEFSVFVDADFSTEQIQQISDGLADWQDKAPIVKFNEFRQLSHSEIWDRPANILYDKGDLYIVRCEHFSDNCHCPSGKFIGDMRDNGTVYTPSAQFDGGPFKNNRVICIDMEWAKKYPEGMDRAIRHETGHALGLDHNNNKNESSVMHPFWEDDANTVQPADVKAVYTINGE